METQTMDEGNVKAGVKLSLSQRNFDVTGKGHRYF